MDKVLIDSDVILDSLIDRKPYSQFSSEVLSLCESKKIVGFVTPIILSNLYYILSKNLKHEKAINSLKMLMNFLDVVIVDKTSV